MITTKTLELPKAHVAVGAMAAASAVTLALSKAVVMGQAPACDPDNLTLESGVGCARPEGAAGDVGLFEEGGVFQTITNTLLFLVGAISVIMLIVGGIRYVISAGDSNAVNGAKNTILYAIVGLVVAFLAFAAVNFIIGRLNQ